MGPADRLRRSWRRAIHEPHRQPLCHPAASERGCAGDGAGQLLPVVRDMLSDAIFPEQEIAIYKQNMQQRLSVNLKKCDFVAGRLIDAYLFGKEHPYGKYSSAEEYDALQREELQRFYKKYYTEGKCILFVAGKLPARAADHNFSHVPRPGSLGRRTITA